MDQVHKCKKFEKHTRMPVFDAKLGTWLIDLIKTDAERVALPVSFCPFCGSDLVGETILT